MISALDFRLEENAGFLQVRRCPTSYFLLPAGAAPAYYWQRPC